MNECEGRFDEGCKNTENLYGVLMKCVRGKVKA